MPTSRRRHAVTETPPVEAALDELRRALGGARIEMGELVVLGARAKVAELQAQVDELRARANAERRRLLADQVRGGRLPVDRRAATEVRRKGWVHG